MGDPRRLRKKYEGPRHPFSKQRFEEEIKYMGIYGLRNKKEIWKAQTKLRNFRSRGRKSLALPEPHREKEREILVQKLYKLGIMPVEDGLIDEVLSLSVERFLDRRLQSVVHERGLAKTPWMARQLIVHGHIAIGNRKINSPSYAVKRGEDELVTYAPDSPFNNPSHPALTLPTSEGRFS